MQLEVEPSELRLTASMLRARGAQLVDAGAAVGAALGVLGASCGNDGLAETAHHSATRWRHGLGLLGVVLRDLGGAVESASELYLRTDGAQAAAIEAHRR